jgi:hypothetical protein
MNRVLQRTALVTAAMAGLVGFCATGQASAATESPAATVAPAAVPASTGCVAHLVPNTSLQYVGGDGWCTNTTDSYRLKLTCEDELRGDTAVYYGAYVKEAYSSTARCPVKGGSQWLATAASIQLK